MTETIEKVAAGKTRTAVLDTVERVSEMCFGLFMALTFVGAVAALGGSDSPQAMFNAALGCNLAWGLVDAVMYLVRTLTLRGKRLGLKLAEVKDLVDMYESRRDTDAQLRRFLDVLARHRAQLEARLGELRTTLDEVLAQESAAKQVLRKRAKA